MASSVERRNVITELGGIRRSGFRNWIGHQAGAPLFFVSVASKGFKFSVTPLKSILTGPLQVLIPKELGHNKGECNLGVLGERNGDRDRGSDTGINVPERQSTIAITK
jgi:hypothetical protein